MNILHISNTDLAGGRFTGYYMQQVIGQSHNVEMAVWNKTSNNSKVHSLKSGPFLQLSDRIIQKLDRKLGLEGLIGQGGRSLAKRSYFKNADIIHLHLIHNDSFFSPLSLSKISRIKPVIWTIHDCWAMTGGCLYSFDCEKWRTGCKFPCPYPRHNSLFQHRIPNFHWHLKKHIYQNSNISLVVASEWMKNRVRNSPLLNNFQCDLIPFGIDLEMFCPRNKEDSRRKLGIWPNQKVIAFRDSGSNTDKFKGLKWIMEVLQMYEPKQPTCLLILQDGRAFRSLWPKYSVITPGWIDGEELAYALSAADIFLMPSIQEAFGLMAVESMACATPVITFEGTSLPDVINAPQGGLSVPARDSIALLNAISLLLENDELRIEMGKKARLIAEKEYSFELYVQRHLSLYEDVICQRQKNNFK